MTKKHFIELADALRHTNATQDVLDALASFCKRQNCNFKRERWFAYIRGECGPSGGKIKQRKAS